MVIWVVEFSSGGTILERFLPKNQYTQRILLNFQNWCNAQNSQQKSVPDLYVLTVAFLALKNGFSEKKNFPPKKFFFWPFFNATFQCGRYNVFKKILNFFFATQNIEKLPKKVAHNPTRPPVFSPASFCFVKLRQF